MLFYDLQEVWDAFWILNKTRSNNVNGLESLKLIEIKALIELFDINYISKFIDYIYVLDEEYLKLVDKKFKKEEQDKEKRSKLANKKGTGNK